MTKGIVIFVSLFVWAVILLAYPPSGFDLAIYRYNAQQTLEGLPSYGREAHDFVYGQDFQSPRYQDYTGLQHLVYTLVEQAAAWRLYHWGITAALLLIATQLANSSVVLLALHPAVFVLLYLDYFSDKALILVTILAVWLLWERRYYRVFGLVLGLACAWHGILLFFVPAALILLLHQGRWRISGWIAVGLVIGLLPFFPDALHGWLYRAARSAWDTPIWWSLWRAVPALYAPFVDKAFWAAGMAGAALVATRGRARLALVMAVFAPLCLGADGNPTRMLVWVLLAGALYPVQMYSAVVMLPLLAWANQSGNADINRRAVIALWSALGFLAGWVWYKEFRE